ncbi:MAG: ECF transporter S component [Candidatus Asgardarchaeia archaeon]
MAEIWGLKVVDPAKGEIGGVHVSIIAVWTAVMLAVTAIPAYPVPGMAGVITVAVILSTLTGALLGPIAGLLFGLVFSTLEIMLFPYTAFFGILTILCPTANAFVAGLVVHDRWKEASAIYVVLIAIWFAHDYGRYQLMPIIPILQWVPPLIFILVPQIRYFIIKSIAERDVKKLPIAFLLLQNIGYMAENAVGCDIWLWWAGWSFPYIYWVGTTAYHVAVHWITAIIGGIVATPIWITLKKIRVKTFGNILEKKYLVEEAEEESEGE